MSVARWPAGFNIGILHSGSGGIAGYCSTVRSNVAKAEGLTEDMINDLFSYSSSKYFTPREKAALRYAELFKHGEHAIDKDEVYQDLSKHFSDEEIIELGLFCAEVDGVGKFVKSLNVLSWEEACQLDPKLTQGAAAQVAQPDRGAQAFADEMMMHRRAGEQHRNWNMVGSSRRLLSLGSMPCSDAYAEALFIRYNSL